MMYGIDKPYSPACEQNKAPILSVLAPLLEAERQVLEVGSGTGQHAVHFAAAMPHLNWQCSDVAEQLPGIRRWVEDASLPNLPVPIRLDVDNAADWPKGRVDAVFSANTAHIMSLPQVQRMFDGIGRLLPDGAAFALYGPFSTNGRHTSRSNQDFDRMLRLNDPSSGVRDLTELAHLAGRAGLWLEQDLSMPVNNRTLIWRKHQQTPTEDRR